jgi:hypothetical protein
MSDAARLALDIAYRVLFTSLWFAIPIVMLILLMYGYEKYKKWKDAEKKEAERIIVKMNEDVIKTTETINVLKPIETELRATIATLQEKVKELKQEAGETEEIQQSEPSDAPEEIKTKKPSIKELHKLAKERKIKGFSRMKQDELIKILGK